MFELINVSEVAETQPYFYHERVDFQQPPLTVPITARLPYGYFNFKVDFGFFYLLRRIRVHYAQFNSVGGVHTVYMPALEIDIVEKALNTIPQNVPIPTPLFCTPGNEGVTIDPAGAGAYAELTATAPMSDKLINKVFPNGSNLEIFVRWNTLPPAGTAFPMYAHIVLIGYLVPDKTIAMWGGK